MRGYDHTPGDPNQGVGGFLRQIRREISLALRMQCRSVVPLARNSRDSTVSTRSALWSHDSVPSRMQVLLQVCVTDDRFDDVAYRASQDKGLDPSLDTSSHA